VYQEEHFVAIFRVEELSKNQHKQAANVRALKASNLTVICEPTV
jgi:hypothetical protein